MKKYTDRTLVGRYKNLQIEHANLKRELGRSRQAMRAMVIDKNAIIANLKQQLGSSYSDPKLPKVLTNEEAGLT